MKVMTNKDFCEKLRLALNSKTQYARGGFGAPLGVSSNRQRYIDYQTSQRTAEQIANAPDGTFLFDCVCLGKGILWGWDADEKALYGGADYAAKGVPDFWSGDIRAQCVSWSADMSTEKIEPGEWLLHSDGEHIGYYVGDGKVIECTAAGPHCVCMTSLATRIYGGRWIGHGKIKYIDYIKDDKDDIGPPVDPSYVFNCPHCGKEVKVCK